MADDVRTVVSCPKCGRRLSVNVSQNDPKAFNCNDPSCGVFTVLPDLSVHKGDIRRIYRQKMDVLSNIRSIQERLEGIPDVYQMEERAIIKDLKEKVADLKEKIRAMRDNPTEEVFRLETVSKEQESRIRSQDQEISILKAEIDSMRSSIDALRRKQEQENALIGLPTTSSDPDLEKKFKLLQQKFKDQAAALNATQSRLSELEGALSVSESARRKDDAKMGSMAGMEIEVQERSILLDDREMDLEAREKALDAREAELATREEGLHLAEEDVRKARADLDDLRTSLEPVQAEIAREREVLKREREYLQTLKASIPNEEALTSIPEGRTSAELENEASRLAEWEKDLSGREELLRTKEASTTSENDDRLARLKEALQRKNDEVQALKASLAEAEAKAARSGMMAEGQTAQEPPWKEEMEARESALALKVAEVEKRQSELATYHEQLTNYHNDLTGRIESYNQEYSELQKQKALLQDERAILAQTPPQQGSAEDAARIAKAESESGSLARELEKVKGELEKRNALIIRMQEKLSRPQGAPIPSSTDQNLIGEKDAEIERLRSAVLQLQSSVAELERERASAREQTERTMVQNASEYESRLSEKDRTISDLESALARMQEVQMVQGASDAEKARADEAAARIAELESENFSLKTRLSDLERTSSMRSETSPKIENAIAVLRGKLEDSLKANRELAEERDRLASSMERAGIEASAAEDLRSRMEERERRIAELESDLRATSASALEKGDVEAELKQRIAALSEEMATVRSASEEAARNALSELSREREEKEGLVERLRREGEANERLKDRLRTKLDEIASLERRLKPKGPTSDGETIFECPYCKSSIPDANVPGGECPSCGRRFKVSDEVVIELYECPSCGRTLTRNAIASGECAFCGTRFHV